MPEKIWARGTLQKILKGNKAIVTGLNLVKHTKPNPQMGITGGIVEQEAAIAISNLAIWNPKKKKADRIGYEIKDDVKQEFLNQTTENINMNLKETFNKEIVPQLKETLGLDNVMAVPRVTKLL